MIAQKATIWITGASSGIGRALALALALPDRSLIVSGRSRDRLEECAALCRERGAAVELLPFDLGDHAAREAAIRSLDNRPVDVLVNNAGISQRSLTTETPFDVDRTLMEIDYFSGVHLTKAIVPGMVERGSGRIIAVSSMAGLAGTPLRSAYGAAKAAQIAFYSSLANELMGTGVSAHVVIAGFVRTDISLNALTGDGGTHGQMDSLMSDGVAPDRAAGQIIHGVEAGRVRIRTGLTPKARLFFFTQRWFPRFLDRTLRKVAGT